ncbi:hypothetical protein GSY71_09825 [Pusillimonas sp. TS35]|uniref:C40 family peptidase n=1 Tax=Paracandidimonas lactea TaxID=2895524 RepID=UPI0013698732|nr:C40 family peptidase [Paracandidimonas lactea]MYN13436.1 hypothetical protein [Pusillimonas sp. TS35]
MPPQQLSRLSPSNIPLNLWRFAKILVVVSSVALAGCAANNSAQHADASAASSINRQLRNSYLSRTQSDPLGSYLATRERSDYPISHAQASSPTMVATALSLIGTKYRFGGDEPESGFDCSGLVVYAAEQSLGLKLPRRSRDLAHAGKAVEHDELKRGDLVFFNTRGHRFSHVGIYLGNRKFVHAPRSGAVVRVENMDITYWAKRYNGARRLAAASNTLAVDTAIDTASTTDAGTDIVKTTTAKASSKPAAKAPKKATTRTKTTVKAKAVSTSKPAPSPAKKATTKTTAKKTPAKSTAKVVMR